MGTSTLIEIQGYAKKGIILTDEAYCALKPDGIINCDVGPLTLEAIYKARRGERYINGITNSS